MGVRFTKGQKSSQKNETEPQIRVVDFKRTPAIADQLVYFKTQEVGNRIISALFRRWTDEFSLHIPAEIYKLCVAFYQSNWYEWNIDIHPQATTCTRSIHTFLPGASPPQFVTIVLEFTLCRNFGVNLCLLRTKLDSRQSKFTNGGELRFFYRLQCKQLEIDQRSLNVMYHPGHSSRHRSSASNVCHWAPNATFSQIPPDVDRLEFQIYVEVLPKAPQRITSPSPMREPFVWELSETLIAYLYNDVTDGDATTYTERILRCYSPVIAHEGAFCLKVERCPGKEKDDEIQLQFSLLTLANPNEYDGSTCGDWQLAITFQDQRPLFRGSLKSMHSPMIHFAKKHVVKCIEFRFTFGDELCRGQTKQAIIQA